MFIIIIIIISDVLFIETLSC